MRSLWGTLMVLGGIWIIASAVILFSRSSASTPAKLQAFIEANPVKDAVDAERLEIIGKAADQVNRLTFDQRYELRDCVVIRKFLSGLTVAERAYFLDLTMPEGSRQMMAALNKMTPERRLQLVQRALNDLRKRDTTRMAERMTDEDIRKVLTLGASSYYEDATADVKLDFAPVLEELQRSMEAPR